MGLDAHWRRLRAPDLIPAGWQFGGNPVMSSPGEGNSRVLELWAALRHTQRCERDLTCLRQRWVRKEQDGEFRGGGAASHIHALKYTAEGEWEKELSYWFICYPHRIYHIDRRLFLEAHWLSRLSFFASYHIYLYSEVYLEILHLPGRMAFTPSSPRFGSKSHWSCLDVRIQLLISIETVQWNKGWKRRKQ